MNVSSLSGITVSLAGLGLFCMPGILFARRFLAGRRSFLTVAAVGLPLGLAVGTGLSVLLTLGLGAPPLAATVLSTCLLTVMAIFFPGLDGTIRIPPCSRRWTCTVLISTAALLAVILAPLSLVGEKTAQGYAYGNYFNVDYLKNLALASSLGRSGLPPMSPFMAGSRLRYYWFFLWYPGLLYRAGMNAAAFSAGFMAYASIWPLVLVILLFLWWRRLGVPARWGAAALWIAVSAPSLNAAAYIGRLAANNNLSANLLFLQDIEFISPLNFARVPFFVDGLFRYLLYIQLHLFSLLLSLLGLWILASPAPGGERKAFFLSAVPIGLGIFFSDVIGVLGVLAWATGALCRVFSSPRDEANRIFRVNIEARKITVPVWMKSAGIIAAFAWLLAAGLFPETRIGWHAVFLMKLAVHFVVEYGPLALIGCLGLAVIHKTGLGSMFYALFFIPALVLFLVGERQYLGNYLPAFAAAALNRYPFHISVKTSAVVLVSLLIPAGLGLQAMATACRQKIRPGNAVPSVMLIVLLVVLALPGSILDLGYHCDTGGILRNIYISPDEMAAIAWVRENISQQAVFLCAPYRPGSLEHPENTISVIPSLAYRDVLLGDPHHIMLYTAGNAAGEMERRSRCLELLRAGGSDDYIVDKLRVMGVTNVFLGPRERELWGPAVVARLQQALPVLYTAGGVSIHVFPAGR